MHVFLEPELLLDACFTQTYSSAERWSLHILVHWIYTLFGDIYMWFDFQAAVLVSVSVSCISDGENADYKNLAYLKEFSRRSQCKYLHFTRWEKWTNGSTLKQLIQGSLASQQKSKRAKVIKYQGVIPREHMKRASQAVWNFKSGGFLCPKQSAFTMSLKWGIRKVLTPLSIKMAL